MKKSYRNFILIGSFLMLIIVEYFITQLRTTYKLPPNICLALFGCEPDQFFDWELDYYTPDNDFRKHAKVDENGNLILRLNNKDKEIFRNEKNWGIGIDDLKKRDNIKISADYSKITIYCYAETASVDLLYVTFGVSSLAVEQVLNNRDPATISVEIIVKDAVTKDTAYAVSWPEETFRFSSKDYSFSKKNES